MLAKLFRSPALNSRIKSANTERKEGVFGYFLGPCFVYMAYYAIAGTYLTQFYTDVLGVTGLFITLVPVLSKVFDAFTNIVMGRIIDRTKTKQGKARPWIFISGILMAMTGVMLYAVPRASMQVQLVWIVLSYNLYFAFAFTIYNMSHTLMVPLSTRNARQRDSLAMLTSTGTTMLPGLLVTIILPIMIQKIGVGDAARTSWFTVMSIISVLAFPATILEYYFTKERVTEEADKAEEKGDTIPFTQQIKACFKDEYWLKIMAIWAVYNIINILSTNTILYFCNWVLGSSVDEGTGYQILVNAIGQAPLGFGIFILWPLVKKFGKRIVAEIGFVIGAVGCAIVLLAPHNLPVVLAGLFIKSIGALPTYLNAAFMAEALDHIEWKNGYRADGFSASVNSIIITITAGIGQSIILGGISRFGYIQPTSTADVIAQPGSIQTFFTFCFVGSCLIGYLLCALLIHSYKVSDNIGQITEEIIARHKAEAEARGEEYVSPEELAAREQEELERIAEEKRIEELKEKCRRKGLNFEEEEAKYQAKLQAEKEKKKARK